MIWTDKETFSKRIKTCRSCEYIKRIYNPLKLFNNKTMNIEYNDRPDSKKTVFQCDKCKCIMNVKARMKNADCPIGKW